MPRIQIKTKELKELIKQLTTLSSQNSSKNVIVCLKPETNKVLVYCRAEYAQTITALETAIIMEGGESISFDIAPLGTMSINSKEVVLYWDSTDPTYIGVNHGNFDAKLNYVTNTPKFLPEIDIEQKISLPIKFLEQADSYLSIPFSYFKGKRELMPLRITSHNNCVVAMADDGFSLGVLETQILFEEEIDVKVPRYLFDVLYSHKKAGDNSVDFGINDMQVWMSNGPTKLLTQCTDDVTYDFYEIYDESQEVKYEIIIDPDKALKSFKDLLTAIPANDRASSYVKMYDDKNSIKMSINRNDIGRADLGELEGIIKLTKHTDEEVHIHPKAFYDYINLVKKNKQATLKINSKMSLLESVTDVGTIRYLFPNVSI